MMRPEYSFIVFICDMKAMGLLPAVSFLTFFKNALYLLCTLRWQIMVGTQNSSISGERYFSFTCLKEYDDLCKKCLRADIIEYSVNH